MRYREIDLNLFIVFDALLHSTSVSRAAKTLGLSQSAVSQSLAKLRRHFGDELFLKSSTGVTPTSTAIALADDIRKLITFSEAALTPRAAFDPIASPRDIRISTSDMGEILVAPVMLEAFARFAPNCRLTFLDLWGEELREGLERGTIDLVINGRQPPGGDVLQQKLFDDTIVVLAHGASRLGPFITEAEFAALPHLAVSPGRLDHVNPDDVGTFRGMPRNVVAQVSNWLAVPHLIEPHRELIAVAPSLLAQAYRRFDLKVLKPTFNLPKFDIFQFWHRRVNADPFSLWLRSKVHGLFARSAAALDTPSAGVRTSGRSPLISPLPQ